MNSTIALYARTSRDNPIEGTIDSQIAQLKDYCHENNLAIEPDLIFTDKGISGASLVRPGLDSLRDKAFEGIIDSVIITCPDRLARKYAHQLILEEEFKKLGVKISFCNRDLSTSTPEDQLLFQMQGIIAEYEREKIMERSRRGKLYKAKNGKISVLAGACYGYIYTHKGQREDASLSIHTEEAKVVKSIFNLYAYEDFTMWKIKKRLNEQNIPTKNRNHIWHRSVIHSILRNPTYVGHAAYRKTQAIPRKKARRREDGKKFPNVINSSRLRRPESEWITIETPAIIDQKTFDIVQRKLEINKKSGGRLKAKYNYLSSGLLRCQECNYSYYVNTSGAKSGLFYYRCIGNDKHRFADGRKCWTRPVRVEVIDDLVWDQVKKIIKEPHLVLQEYNKRMNQQKVNDSQREEIIIKKKKEIKRKEIEKERLIDLFQIGKVKKEEIGLRLDEIRLKIKKIEIDIDNLKDQKELRKQQLILLEQFEDFKKKVDLNLDNVNFEEKKRIVRLVVNEVMVDTIKHEITVKHILPTRNSSVCCPDGGIWEKFPR